MVAWWLTPGVGHVKGRSVVQVLGCFPLCQNFRSNQLKCKWNVWFKQKFSGTNGCPSEVLHFFHSNWLEQKLLFHLPKISISTFHKSVSTDTNFLGHHNLPVRLQDFSPAWKKPFLLTRKISRISNQKFWLNGQRPWSLHAWCCFLRHKTLLHMVSRHPDIKIGTCSNPLTKCWG